MRRPPERPKPVRRPLLRGCRRRACQRGVVLFVVLVLLMLLSIVGLQTMDSSVLGARSAVVNLGYEESFQAAESVLAQGRAERALVVAAWLGQRAEPATAAVTREYALPRDRVGRLAVTFVGDSPAAGHDVVLGRAGLQRLHFELRASVARSDGRFESRHRQGLAYLAPRTP